MKRTMPLLVLFPLLFLLFSCGEEDKNPTGPSAPVFINSSPDSLILTFEEAYTSRDSAAYAALLDSAYTFWNLPLDSAGVMYPREWWDLNEELKVAGRMFSGWKNGRGASVDAIGLSLSISNVTTDTTSYPGKPQDEMWYRMITNVDMSVVIDDPESVDGICSRLVLSNQIFIVRPDPANEGLWVVYRQEDQWFALKSGTEETNWGAVKGLFRDPESENASWGEVKNLFR